MGQNRTPVSATRKERGAGLVTGFVAIVNRMVAVVKAEVVH
jgi:hypothetical protein